jgi:hypothetical protein
VVANRYAFLDIVDEHGTPDVELALILQVGLLRSHGLYGRPPPCVVGLGSHRLVFVTRNPGKQGYACCGRRSICLLWSAVCPISDSVETF